MWIDELDKRIAWQYKTKIRDAAGGYTDTWTTVCTTWAAIRPISAMERIKNNIISDEATHRIRINYRSYFKSGWRGMFGNRYFAIIGQPINPNEANEYLEMIVKEVS